jgi:hypothetical protein
MELRLRMEQPNGTGRGGFGLFCEGSGKGRRMRRLRPWRMPNFSKRQRERRLWPPLPNPPGTAAGLPDVNGRLPRNSGLPLDRGRPGGTTASAGSAEGLLESACGACPAATEGNPERLSGFGRFARRVRKKERGLMLAIRRPDGEGRRFGAAPDPPRGSNGQAPVCKPPAQRDAAPAGGPWSWDSGGRWQHRPPLRIRLQLVLGAGRA